MSCSSRSAAVALACAAVTCSPAACTVYRAPAILTSRSPGATTMRPGVLRRRVGGGRPAPRLFHGGAQHVEVRVGRARLEERP